MIKKALIIVVLLLSGNPASPQNCGCANVPDTEKTHSAYSHGHIVYSKARTVRSFDGVVIFPKGMRPEGESIPETLVEVFTDGEVLVMGNSPEAMMRREKQKRVAACKTGDDGKFCFDDLPSGKYELRCSKVGFEPVSYIINYKPDRKGGSKKMIEVEMPIS